MQKDYDLVGDKRKFLSLRGLSFVENENLNREESFKRTDHVYSEIVEVTETVPNYKITKFISCPDVKISSIWFFGSIEVNPIPCVAKWVFNGITMVDQNSHFNTAKIGLKSPRYAVTFVLWIFCWEKFIYYWISQYYICPLNFTRDWINNCTNKCK